MGAMFSQGPGEGDNRPISIDGMLETVTIPEVTMKQGDDGSYAAYMISVKLREQLPYQVYRRYKFFARLHLQLQQLQSTQATAAAESGGEPPPPLPPLPGKKLFGSTSKAFMNKRRLALQYYLQELGRSVYAQSPDYLSFLGVETDMLNSGGFDWTQRTGRGNGFGGTFSPQTKGGESRAASMATPQ